MRLHEGMMHHFKWFCFTFKKYVKSVKQYAFTNIVKFIEEFCWFQDTFCLVSAEISNFN